jgi:flavorubredoxin
MLTKILYEDNHCKWVMFGRDPQKKNSVIDTNEYAIIVNNEAILLDPGGIEIFPAVLTAISEILDVKNIKAYLCSHQDPDIMSSLQLWLGLTPDAKVYLSWLWEGFIAHFGGEYVKNFVSLPDEGGLWNLIKKDLNLFLLTIAILLVIFIFLTRIQKYFFLVIWELL